MAQSIEMNEEIEDKLALIKSLKSKLRFFRGTILVEVILLIIILLYSCGIFNREDKVPIEVSEIEEEKISDKYDIFLSVDKPDFSIEGIQAYTPSDLLGSIEADFMSLSDDCGGAYSYDEGILYYITNEETKSIEALPEMSLYCVNDIVERWTDLKSDYIVTDSVSDISFVHSDTKYSCNAWQLYSYEDIEYDTSAYWSEDINLPAIHGNLIIDSQKAVRFQISVSGQDIEEIRLELEKLLDGLEYGKVEKSGEEISYMINILSVQADMLFYGDSGVALPERWTIGYDDNADIIVTVYIGGTYYAPEALL